MIKENYQNESYGADKTNIEKAIDLAIKYHVFQVDTVGKEYIFHCLVVMGLTQKFCIQNNIEDDGNELAQIAVLHDIIEDDDMNTKELKVLGFSDRIISGIECLTKVKGQTYEEYKNKVISNIDAIIVKMSYLIHNMDNTRITNVTEKDIKRSENIDNF